MFSQPLAMGTQHSPLLTYCLSSFHITAVELSNWERNSMTLKTENVNCKSFKNKSPNPWSRGLWHSDFVTPFIQWEQISPGLWMAHPVVISLVTEMITWIVGRILQPYFSCRIRPTKVRGLKWKTWGCYTTPIFSKE